MKLLLDIIKGNNPKTLVAVNFAIILLTIYGLVVTPFSGALWAVTAFMYFVMISFGISVTYHRSLTHKAVTLHPIIEKLGVFFASMAGTGSPIMWVMTHRQHHRYSDKDGDPHPPGKVWKTFFGVYPQVSTAGIRDIAHKPFNRFMHKYYFAILAAYGLAILALGGVNLFFHAFVYVVFLSVAISNTLNWYGHAPSVISYRNYNVRDHSQNHPLMGYFAFGEGWHNNHHRFPGSAKFGVNKHEFDISYMLILLMSKLGLAHSIKTHKE